jgi:hypothetical protein
VTYYVDFADLGQTFEIVITTKFRGDVELGFLHIERRKPVSNATRL